MTRPNVLLILTDQHAPAVSGFAGDPVVRTQNLDDLAARSAYFPAATCASPICTPSRMTMLTGKDVHRCAAWGNHWPIFPEHLTWPQHFADHGYATCLVGKMHFGGRDQMQGFARRPYGDLRHGLGHQPEPLSLFPGYQSARSAGPTEIPESLLQDVVVTRETISYVLEQQDRDTPWFTVAGYSRPHPPFTAPGRYIRHYRDRVPPPDPGRHAAGDLEPFARLKFERGDVADLTDEEITRGREAYYACVDFVDDCIGELLETLHRAGALENTIVIYTSDHGEMAGVHGLWSKTMYFEPSAGVPLLMTGPGIVAGHHRIETPFSLMDLYPTVSALAGLPVPDGLDGVDWSAFLGSPESTPPRSWVPSTYVTYGDRVGYAKALTHDSPGSGWRAVREQQWKYVDVQNSQPLLFDLANDPGESVNLAPDPVHAGRVRSMKDLAFTDFSWDAVIDQLLADQQRLPDYLSGVRPTVPNQYMLEDGRQFDAEAELYGARWLHVPPGMNGGIIPQMYG
ncbi:MAG TPA: sulfatase-like hydrolase/transferase [Mycobacteriales bacterium]|nr:sulfatase-like hydrolase/transferase [Mycobacteriales bacterium]